MRNKGDDSGLRESRSLLRKVDSRRREILAEHGNLRSRLSSEPGVREHLKNEVESLRREYNRLSSQAELVQRQVVSRSLRVGMTVYFGAIPLDLIFAGLDHEAALRVERLTPQKALISRADGGAVLGGGKRRIWWPRDRLRTTLASARQRPLLPDLI
jgi:hypothetical protein